MPMIESTEPNGSSWASSGSRDFGSRNQPGDEARWSTIGMFTRNTEPYQKCVSRNPLATGPIIPAQPATAAHAEIAFVRSSGGNTFTRIDSVDGMMNAAPTPMRPRHAMSCHVLCESVAPTQDDEEDHQPELQRTLAAEPVADRAGGEQQAREHERVRRDHPLQLRLAWRGARATASGSRR